MTYLMLLFGQDAEGAIVANIEPNDAVGLIEVALMAARNIEEVTEIVEERRH